MNTVPPRVCPACRSRNLVAGIVTARRWQKFVPASGWIWFGNRLHTYACADCGLLSEFVADPASLPRPPPAPF